MPAFPVVRIVALILVASAALVAELLLDARRDDHRDELSWPRHIGPYESVELRDPLLEDAIRLTGGRYLYREYKSGDERINLFAIAAPTCSSKDLTSCLRIQGWVVIRDEALRVQTARGHLSARKFVLASPDHEPRQTMYAIGFWRWGNDKFINNYIEARIYGLLDSMFWANMSWVQVYTVQDVYYTDADFTSSFSLLQRFMQHWAVPDRS